MLCAVVRRRFASGLCHILNSRFQFINSTICIWGERCALPLHRSRETIQNRWQTKKKWTRKKINMDEVRKKEFEKAANILFIVVRGTQMWKSWNFAYVTCVSVSVEHTITRTTHQTRDVLLYVCGVWPPWVNNTNVSSKRCGESIATGKCAFF